MSTASSAESVSPQSQSISSASVISSRVADYFEITKPRIAVMALVTVTLGFILGSESGWQTGLWLNSMLGIALVAVSSSALNQYIERESDQRMARTANRPLPAGRLPASEVLWFGLLTGVVGVAWLWFFVNQKTAWFSIATLFLYVAIYTPLKRHTTLCTTIGAVPGALPPVLGWLAAGGPMDIRALTLFAILFLWQFPHFLAIAWLYRQQYADAGLKMLPANGSIPRLTALISLAYGAVLLPVSLLPGEIGLAGSRYMLVAGVLGVMYLLSVVRFLVNETDANARRVLWCSLIYLPLLLISMTWDHLDLLS